MEEPEKDDIGYMQVQFKVFKSKERYDHFGINAFDECFCSDRELISTHHQVVGDEAQVYDRVFQVKLFLKATGFTIMMHMPIHQSDDWEYLGDFEDYEVYFFCILGKKARDFEDCANESSTPNKLLHRIKKGLAFFAR